MAVHDHLRDELDRVRELVAQVIDHRLDPGVARGAINAMTIRQNNWTVGAYCASYCRLVATHHTIEDQALFPSLRAADGRLGPVLDTLQAEHLVIHEVLEDLDRALVAFVGTEPDPADVRRAVDELADTLRSHLAYEEHELTEPIARLGVMV